ncbi:LPS translocon maturation chaperone LptM [Congregibacter sp.]|uniref:LPS translocon maturation chaperone LptM n=1 Tax=Congregibacter sp. TaxID=2744308 RepID=UPI003F6AC250
MRFTARLPPATRRTTLPGQAIRQIPIDNPNRNRNAPLIFPCRKRHAPETALLPSGLLLTALLPFLGGCGQMGPLYQPQPEEPQSAQLAIPTLPGSARSSTGSED